MQYPKRTGHLSTCRGVIALEPEQAPIAELHGVLEGFVAVMQRAGQVHEEEALTVNLHQVGPCVCKDSQGKVVARH